MPSEETSLSPSSLPSSNPSVTLSVQPSTEPTPSAVDSTSVAPSTSLSFDITKLPASQQPSSPIIADTVLPTDQPAPSEVTVSPIPSPATESTESPTDIQPKSNSPTTGAISTTNRPSSPRIVEQCISDVATTQFDDPEYTWIPEVGSEPQPGYLCVYIGEALSLDELSDKMKELVSGQNFGTRTLSDSTKQVSPRKDFSSWVHYIWTSFRKTKLVSWFSPPPRRIQRRRSVQQRNTTSASRNQNDLVPFDPNLPHCTEKGGV